MRKVYQCAAISPRCSCTDFLHLEEFCLKIRIYSVSYREKSKNIKERIVLLNEIVKGIKREVRSHY